MSRLTYIAGDINLQNFDLIIMSYPEYFQTQQHDFMFNLPAGSVYDFDSFDLNLDEEERDSTAVRVNINNHLKN